MADPSDSGIANVARQAVAWLRLAMVHGIGPLIGRQLVRACGSIEQVWQFSAADWHDIDGVGPRLVQALAKSDARQAERIANDCQQHDIAILCPADDAYPYRLNNIEDAPLVLFARGDLAHLNHHHMLAVVGARRASREGRLIARRWCRHLSERHIGIVSGMAYGIDTAAHAGALEAKAPTIAVLGSGLAVSFSIEQQRQMDAIAAQGCVISEFLPETTPRPEYFPRRNRIIAGLADATIVIEADIRSGSLITARQAVEYGREVFAVPGSILSGNHAGCHQLIRDGAILAESAADMLKHMAWQHNPGRPQHAYTPASEQETAVIAALKQNILHLDTLAEICDLTVPELSPILLALELQGVIERLPGSRYALVL
ncbi:MAG: DNA-processing protein DprA [Mariprofundaceae bacterium]